MKIRPVILCGGAGTRLWPKAKKHQAKQFIDFGNWTLLGKTLERVKASIFDAPIKTPIGIPTMHAIMNAANILFTLVNT